MQAKLAKAALLNEYCICIAWYRKELLVLGAATLTPGSKLPAITVLVS